MTLQRTRLLARLFASEPRLLRLWAPPGYGKSSLARLFARRFDRHAICDCSGAGGVVEVADRAMAALADESPDGGDAVAGIRLRLHASEADDATWSRALLDLWKHRREHALFVFEHAEVAVDDAAILALLGDLLAARPPERVVLMSSRFPLPLRFAHFLAPHQTLTLTDNELRLDASEAGALFNEARLTAETVHRVVQLADGCPMVLLLLALFAQYDANIDDLLDRLSIVAAPHRYEQLVNDLLDALTPDMTATLLAIAAIPNASFEDISAATDIRHATPIIDRLLRLPGFLSAEHGRYRTHALLGSALRARYETELANARKRAAGEYERSGDSLRAAELYSACGDEMAAAAALDALPAAVLAQPSSRVVDALAKVTMSTVCRYPNLWIANLPHRREHVPVLQLYDEGQRLLSSVPAASSSRPRLCVRIAILAQELGRLAEAGALIAESATPSAGEDTPEERRLILMTAALIAARHGHFADADRLVDESDAVHGARHLRFDAERVRIAMEKTRFRGDWDGALKLSDEALHAAQRSGATSRIIDAAGSVAQAAWFCNDDARESAANQLLEDCGDPNVYVLPPWRSALHATDADEARALLDETIAGLDRVEHVFPRIVARVCSALLLPTERRRLLEAQILAEHVESPPLQASLELLIDSPEPSDYGIFRQLAERVARSPLKTRQDALYVDVVRGRVRRGNDVVHVSDRGLELLAALALLPPGTSKEALAAAIWPALDGDGALNTLKMCVSRTRAQVADKDAIASTKRGYALGERVAVDIHTLERLLAGLREADVVNDALRGHVESAIRALAPRDRQHAAGWAWFAPHAAHLDELRNEFMLVRAKQSWHHADDAAARTSPLAAGSARC